MKFKKPIPIPAKSQYYGEAKGDNVKPRQAGALL